MWPNYSLHFVDSLLCQTAHLSLFCLPETNIAKFMIMYNTICSKLFMQERLFCWKIICIFKEKKLFITNIYVMNFRDTGSFTLNIFFVPMQYRKIRKLHNMSFSFHIKRICISIKLKSLFFACLKVIWNEELIIFPKIWYAYHPKKFFDLNDQ